LGELKEKKIHTDIKVLNYNDKNELINELFLHKSILSSRCSYFNELISEENDFIKFNNINPIALESYINFLYTGKIDILKSIEDISDFIEFSKNSKTNYETISNICENSFLYLDILSNIIKKLKKDFKSLIGINEKKKYSDYTLIINDENDIIKIYINSIFLLKSPYFKSMIESGLKETSDKEIVFDNLKYEGFIKY
jgi:hypothetical protein